MNEHDLIKEKLVLAATGSLSVEELQQIRGHLAGCAACQREQDAWSLYTRGLQHLPQPMAPAGLVERTQARILQQHAVASGRKGETLLYAVALFGWVSSFTFWSLIDLFTHGRWALPTLGFLNGTTEWSLISTAFVWITAGAAAVILGNRRTARRML